MCGIAGSFGGPGPDCEHIARTLAVMRNRGPNANGEYTADIGGNVLCLLHTRLSIIDLDPRANQPLETDECVLVFNGEIYNFIELRTDLERRGHKFRTASDSEVIVKAYLEFGESCVDHFEGMWAFALHDRRRDVLFLSRDRFGEKPLYHAYWDGVLYFGSEVKFIAALSGRTPVADNVQIRRFLVNGYKSLYKDPNTYLQGISELPAASSAVIYEPDRLQPTRYWRLSYDPVPMTREVAKDEVKALLYRAMEIRLRADVPIAFCLSGGVDSTALASIAALHFGQKLHAFTVIDKDERYNETENVSATVARLGCDHHVVHTSSEGFFDRMEMLIDYHDSPLSTISYYVHSFLSEGIAANGFKVSISGTAADELFTGYYDHYGFWLAEMHERCDFPDLLADWRGSYGAHVQNPLLQDPLAFQKNPEQRGHIYLNRDMFNELLVTPLSEDFSETNYSGNLLRNRMLNELFHESVPVILREDDLKSMLWSVENRSPYLDRALAEFLFSVPAEHLISNGYVKSLL
ncbi:MAG TPA: asparagine synthase (glutamine-hydrolyzing), partial [Sneathiellales bacterium]|nr:asparagine synthase (glutamine-hydrolyzing) [Sneathiellales bacterium]